MIKPNVIKKCLFLIAIIFAASPVHAEDVTDETASSVKASGLMPSSELLLDKNESTEVPKKKKGFVDRLPQPFRWIIRNWAASDERYAISSFYNWALQLQNSTTFEWVNLQIP